MTSLRKWEANNCFRLPIAAVVDNLFGVFRSSKIGGQHRTLILTQLDRVYFLSGKDFLNLDRFCRVKSASKLVQSNIFRQSAASLSPWGVDGKRLHQFQFKCQFNAVIGVLTLQLCVKFINWLAQVDCIDLFVLGWQLSPRILFATWRKFFSDAMFQETWRVMVRNGFARVWPDYYNSAWLLRIMYRS